MEAAVQVVEVEMAVVEEEEAAWGEPLLVLVDFLLVGCLNSDLQVKPECQAGQEVQLLNLLAQLQTDLDLKITIIVPIMDACLMEVPLLLKVSQREVLHHHPLVQANGSLAGCLLQIQIKLT